MLNKLRNVILITLLFIFGLNFLTQASESEQELNFKYMYYWDRNQVWNHTTGIELIKKLSTFWKFGWNQEFDAVSGASRRLGWNKIGILGDNQLKLDGLSGASKREVRHSEQPSFTYANAGHVASAAFYFSDESDYRSYSPSFSGSWDFNERNTTLGGSAAFFFDDLHPLAPFSDLGGKRKITSLSASLAQTLTPLSLISFTFNTIHSSGLLGHPYTPVITVTGNIEVEKLPDLKTSMAFSTKFVQGYHLFDWLGSFQLEGRYYQDDWLLKSETADLHWYQHFGENFYLSLRARGYHQGAAAFAKDSYDGDELYRTPDIRFYEFSSLTLGAQIASVFPESWSTNDWLPDRWNISYDHGMRDTYGDEDGIHPLYHYQLYSPQTYYVQGTFMAGLGFDF